MLTNVYIAYILWSTMYMIGRAVMMKTGPNGHVMTSNDYRIVNSQSQRIVRSEVR